MHMAMSIWGDCSSAAPMDEPPLLAVYHSVRLRNEHYCGYMAATDYGWRHFLSKEARSSLFCEISALVFSLPLCVNVNSSEMLDPVFFEISGFSPLSIFPLPLLEQQ